MKAKRQEYWSKLLNFYSKRNPPFALSSPSNGNRINANLGPNLNLAFRVEVLVNAEIPGVNKDNIAIRVSVPKDNWEEIEKKGDITEKLESKSLIKPFKGKKFKGGQQIILYKNNVDLENESLWIEQFEWFINNLRILAELFRSYFRPDIPPFRRSTGSKYSSNPKEDIDVLRDFVKDIKRQESEHDISLTSLDNSKQFEQFCEPIIKHFTQFIIK